MSKLIASCAALLLSTSLAFAAGLAAPNPPPAVPCEPSGGFPAWLESFKEHAVAQGISRRTVASALEGVRVNRQVIALDRDQRAFKVDFDTWVRERVTPRVDRARQMLRRHADLLARIEQRYGVPGPILVAIWGLESDFGANAGNMSVVRSLATLAYDCRRAAMFQNELLAALRIIDRGDLTVTQMRGAWAGELGQTQFLATKYEALAVDFDGNGKRDLIGSVPDVLGSTANYLRSFGWRRGQPWDEGTQNFAVLAEWNKAAVYQRAIALFANRLKRQTAD